MGKFAVKTVKTGIKFDLKAGNGEVIASSEVYSSDAACRKGIESVRRNAVEAKLEDQTVEDFAKVTHPKFELYVDKAGEFRFRLKAGNGEIRHAHCTIDRPELESSKCISCRKCAKVCPVGCIHEGDFICGAH